MSASIRCLTLPVSSRTMSVPPSDGHPAYFRQNADRISKSALRRKADFGDFKVCGIAKTLAGAPSNIGKQDPFSNIDAVTLRTNHTKIR